MKRFISRLLLSLTPWYPLLLLCFMWGYSLYIKSYAMSLFLLVSLAICYIYLLLCYMMQKGLYRRLSPYFVESQIPLTKISVISQMPKKQKAEYSCDEIFADIITEQIQVIKETVKPKWRYVTLTHDKVIKILINTGIINGKITIIPLYKHNIVDPQNQLLKKFKKNCKKCHIKKKCRYLRASKLKHQFYFVSFKTKP